jgi:hypothetical protein
MTSAPRDFLNFIQSKLSKRSFSMPPIRTPGTISRARLSIEVSEEVYWKVHKYLGFGMQKRLFGIVIDDMLRMFDEYGQHFLIAMLQKEISYKEFMEDYMEKNKIE